MTEVLPEQLPTEAEIPVVPEQKTAAQQVKEVVMAIGFAAMVDGVFIQPHSPWGLVALSGGIIAASYAGPNTCLPLMDRMQTRTSKIMHPVAHPIEHWQSKRATQQPTIEPVPLSE